MDNHFVFSSLPFIYTLLIYPAQKMKKKSMNHGYGYEIQNDTTKWYEKSLKVKTQNSMDTENKNIEFKT